MSGCGKVALVGAGPGDPGLITVRGLECVRTADVIVYDQLGAPSFLDCARKNALLIDVGKHAGHHAVPQEKINEILVKHASEGKFVVRLKGGDPTVFGRGGEELEVLAAANIEFEVVPGVSSAIAGPIYAGIPLTHRDYSPAVIIATGHESDEKSRSILPWKALAQTDTIVFVMGMKNLAEITARLIEEGKSPHLPVAIIRQATMQSQKTVCGTLATIAEIAEREKITPPAIIVIGENVKLREKLQWFERRPLFGKTIVVTRARAQAGELTRKLTLLGASIIETPTIRIEPIRPNPDFEMFVSNIERYSHLVFTSGNGVECFVSALEAMNRDLRILGGKTIACIGPTTAGCFISRGIRPDFIPERFVAEEMIPFFEKVPKTQIAILRAQKARDILPEALKRIGHEVDVIALYETLNDKTDDGSFEILRKGKIDLVTFTSSSTVEYFAAALSGCDISTSLIKAAAIGPITAETCVKQGFHLVTVAEKHTIDGLINAVRKYFEMQNSSSRMR